MSKKNLSFLNQALSVVIKWDQCIWKWKRDKERGRWDSWGTTEILCSKKHGGCSKAFVQQNQVCQSLLHIVSSDPEFKRETLHIESYPSIKVMSETHICLSSKLPKCHIKNSPSLETTFLFCGKGNFLMAQFLASTNMFNNFWISEHRKI